MAAKKKQKPSNGRAHKRYTLLGSYNKNKVKKLQRIIKAQPNNTAAKETLAKQPFVYSRKPPKAKIWTPSKMRYAQLCNIIKKAKFRKEPEPIVPQFIKVLSKLRKSKIRYKRRKRKLIKHGHI